MLRMFALLLEPNTKVAHIAAGHQLLPPADPGKRLECLDNMHTCARLVFVRMCCSQDRNEKQQAADPAFKVSVQFLNTFFWPKLVQGGHAGEPTRLRCWLPALLHSIR